MSAPYTGGFDPGSQLFAVDGDFTKCDPCGMPAISYPMKGDSILALNDLIVFNESDSSYFLAPLGTYPNIHQWSPNQSVILIEQEFMVAQNAFVPMPLNTPYDVSWSLGFQNQFDSGYPSASIGQTYLVDEGELQDVGGGISKIKRKWASLPPTRSEIEQFSFQFPGIEIQSGQTRLPITQNVMSRIQYDYFIFDDLDVLDLPLFGTDESARRLNSQTGLYPNGLVIPAIQFFQIADGIFIGNGFYTGQIATQLQDESSPGAGDATIPSATEYLNFASGSSTSNGQPAEMVAESSTFTRWMGNIWERRTRFVIAQ